MEAWIIVLVIFIIGIIIVIIASLKNKKSKKKPQKTIQAYLNYGDYVSAGRLYLDENQQDDAADLYFQTPPEKRPAFESMITQRLGQQGSQLFWIKVGRRFERSAPDRARLAFLLAGAYFDVAKMYIDIDDSIRAVEVINHIPINQREATVRRLSQYAFNRAKYTISSDLLRVVGFGDEADAILAVAAYDFGAIDRPQVAATMYDTVGRQDLVGASQERQGEIALSEGRIDAAKQAFEQAIKAYDDTNQPKDALRVEERLKKFALLEQFREYITNGNVSTAEAMLTEISDNFPGIALSDLYAEIASVLEKNGKITGAVTYYDKAADSTNNPLKKQSYVNALRRLGTLIASRPVEGETIAQNDLQERCIVCRMVIRRGEKYTSCPHCKKNAHFSHLVEFVKVQGSCPACHKHIKADQLK